MHTCTFLVALVKNYFCENVQIRLIILARNNLFELFERTKTHIYLSFFAYKHKLGQHLNKEGEYLNRRRLLKSNNVLTRILLPV